jgi:single-strand DNA-binding protein
VSKGTNVSKDLNKVQLIGRLVADPETRYTPQGSAVTNIRIATSRAWKTRDGEDMEETEFTNCTAWNKLAEIITQYLRKGARVYVEGRLDTESWESDAGKKYKTVVVLNDMIMLDSRSNDPRRSEVEDDEPAPQPTIEARPLPSTDMATVRQVKALERLAQERGYAIHKRFETMTIDEAGALLTEWNNRDDKPRKVLELPRDRVSANVRQAQAFTARATGNDEEEVF